MSQPKSVRQIVLPRSTPVPNFAFDELMRRCTSAQFCVLMAIWRKTIGWDKTRDWISISQLTKLTGLSRPTVIAGVKLWAATGLIRRSRSGIRGTVAYEVALDADLQAVTSGLEKLVKRVNQSKTQHSTSQEGSTPPVKAVDTQKATNQKPPGESKAIPDSPAAAKSLAKPAIRARDLKERISACEQHLKNRLLPAADRTRLTRQLAEFTAELARLETEPAA